MHIKIIRKQANYRQSMRILKESGLNPLTYQIALRTLFKNKKLKQKLKDKWFWISGRGMDKDGFFTVDENGELKEIRKEEKLSNENKVRVWSGSQPLSLFVWTDYYARVLGGRFDLGGDDVPQVVAPVVVGIGFD